MRRTFSGKLRRDIIKRDEGKCVYCGKDATGIDHVIPISRGGLTIPANGVCCCLPCNLTKSASLSERWIITGLKRLILHGENIDWVAAIGIEPLVMPKEDEVLNRKINAANILLDVDTFTYTEISEMLDLDIRIVEYLDT